VDDRDAHPLPSRRRRGTGSCRRARSAALGIAVVLVLVLAPAAGAVILPAQTVDGPSEAIVGFGGVAMAEDGTGGLVYLKKVGGVPHVFVSRFVGNQWQAPIEVDRGQPFAASSPRIGAADGGQLIVVWTTPFATEKEKEIYELVGSTLGPGASQFAEPVIIDPDVGEGTSVSPDLAVSSTAQAYLVYRVVEPFSFLPRLRPGDVIERVRVARYHGRRWTVLGAINRNAGISMRAPTAANAPRVAIGQTGNGIVVWQEPEITGTARIWARRLFGSSVDYVMPVTATSYRGASINEDADAPSVAISKLGEAEVAYRQAAGPGSPLPGPRIFLNKLSDGEAESGAEFQGATVADNQVPGGMGAELGPPSLDVDEKQDLRLLYDANGTPRVVEGTDRGLIGTFTLGPAFAGLQAPAASVMNPEGGGVSAWDSTGPAGIPAVAIREDFPEGGIQTALVDGGAGGPIGELGVGRSGLGDGLVAFQQGVSGDAAIVATEVSAPPAQLIVSAPKTWIKPSQAAVSWQPALSSDPPLDYSLVLDGRKVLDAGAGLTAQLDGRRLSDGVHRLQLLVTDAYGEQTLSPPTQLKIDRELPVVKVTHGRGGSVSVRISDSESGVLASAVTVSFGDGARASGKTLYRHRYGHAGVYRITVHVQDHVGNAGTVSEQVSVG